MASVFVSWSGERSRALAEAIAEWIAEVLPDGERPWISTRIGKGARWSLEVGRELAGARIGIICLTPENLRSSWLLFESGALSNAVGDARVCPFLFGLSPADLDGPLAQFQATLADKDDLLDLAITIDSALGRDPDVGKTDLRSRHEQAWPALAQRLAQISNTAITPEGGAIQQVVGALSRNGLPLPELGSQVSFVAGFESHALYSSVLDVGSQRLLVFGRKNRKLFDKEHMEFFRALPAMIDKGFDFRVLFLDPRSPHHVLDVAHRDPDFPSQLRRCIESARSLLSDVGLDPARHLRTYSVIRAAEIIVVDDAVAFTPIRFDEYGRVRGLTKASFTVASAMSPFGHEWVETFESQWSVAASVDEQTTLPE